MKGRLFSICLACFLALSLAGCKNGWNTDPVHFPQYAQSLLLLTDADGVPRLYFANATRFEPYRPAGVGSDDIITSITLQTDRLYAAVPAKQQILEIDLNENRLLQRHTIGAPCTELASNQRYVAAAGGGSFVVLTLNNARRAQRAPTVLHDSLSLASSAAGLFFFAGVGNSARHFVVYNPEAVTDVFQLTIPEKPLRCTQNQLIAHRLDNEFVTYTYSVPMNEAQGPLLVGQADVIRSPLVKRPYEREFVGQLALRADSTLILPGRNATAVSAVALDAWGSQVWYTQGQSLFLYRLTTQQQLAQYTLPEGWKLRHAEHFYPY